VEGILLVDKPAGWTSHDVVAKIRRELTKRLGKKIKVGHAGTLDPMATGLLVLLIGGYTKRAGNFLKLDKTYEGELTLGKISSTGDAEGKINSVSDDTPSEAEVKKAAEAFVGTIKQVPPAYSAIKIKGKEAYKLARAGKELKMEPRVVTIYSLQIISYEYPKIKFSAQVSSGTYIRSLAQDIGAKMGTGAYLSALRRSHVGDFGIEEAMGMDGLSEGKILQNLQK
jgi:tRNA pseudouridine55 synthase